MDILIYCPAGDERFKITRYLITYYSHQLLFAENEQEVIDRVLEVGVNLLILFDPHHRASIIELKDFLRQKRRRLRVRILPSLNNKLRHPQWQAVIDDGLKPNPRVARREARKHPRFQWKPTE